MLWDCDVAAGLAASAHFLLCFTCIHSAPIGSISSLGSGPATLPSLLQGLAEHKDELGAPLCPCRHYDNKAAEAKQGFWNCPCVPMRERKASLHTPQALFALALAYLKPLEPAAHGHITSTHMSRGVL